MISNTVGKDKSILTMDIKGQHCTCVGNKESLSVSHWTEQDKAYKVNLRLSEADIPTSSYHA